LAKAEGLMGPRVRESDVVKEADLLEKALRAYEDHHQLMMETVRRTDGDWKRDFIGHRRGLQQLLIELGNVSEAVDQALQDPALFAQYREAFTRMRHKVALHQADWPVVQIDHGNPDYLASHESVRAANSDFIATAQKVLRVLRRVGRTAETIR
jgi:hypothetical protein